MNRWVNFLKKLETEIVQLSLDKNEECFYRGHSNLNWLLSPGLFRDINQDKGKDKIYISEERWYTESNLYYEFRSRARELEIELTDWDVLFFMQHYRVKTRLLDWTENFGVALYFALNSYDIKIANPCIWIMNPYRFNEKFGHGNDLWEPIRLNNYGKIEYSYSDLLLGDYSTEKKTLFYWDEPIALYPARRNNRLTNQAGYFTIHGNDVSPLNVICQDETILKKIEIPHDVIEDANKFLLLAGINHFSMFPDLEGLSEYLNKKYF